MRERGINTSRVPLSKNVFPSIKRDITNAVQNLKEQVHKLNRIPRRACAIVNARHVGYVAVIRQVLIDAVPARLELYLRTKTVVAICHIHLWRLGIR